MLRLLLVTSLIAAQGLPSLGAAVTLCVHADGGFCLEAEGRCGHGHAREFAAQEDCCDHRHSGLTADDASCDLPCDCTHLPLVDQPTASSRHGDLAISDHNLGARAIAATSEFRIGPTQVAEAVDWGMDLGRIPAALSFLASVMLRC